MKVNMTKKRILVRRKKTDKKTSGGLYIPDVARVLYPEGEVLSVGPDVKTVKEGDVVTFQARCNIEIGEDMIIEEDVVLGIRTKEGLKAVTNRVFINRTPPEQEKGGIIIPDEAQENMPEGEVVSIGVDVMDIKVGDTALFSVRDGIQVDDFLIMRDTDIFALKG